MQQMIAAIVFTMLLPAVAAAQGGADGGTLRLTLEEAIRRGLEVSHRLAEATALSDAAAAVADQRHADGLPQLAAHAGYTRTNHVQPFGLLQPNGQISIIYPDVPDNYRTRVDVELPLYTGGRVDAIERAARSDASAASQDVQAARTDLRLEIAHSYWALKTAIESARVVDESLVQMRAHLEVTRSQLEQGLIAPNDVFDVEAQESRQRMLSIQAHARQDSAEAELERLIGVARGTRIDPIDPLEPAPVDEPSLDSLLAEAQQNRRDRAAIVDRLQAATERERAATAGTKPTVGVLGGYDYSHPNPLIFPREAVWKGSWDAGVSMTWSLFDGGRTRGEIAETSALVRALQARLAEFDGVMAVEVRQRRSELEASLAAVVAAEDGIRAAVESRRVTGERFSAGVATSTDVLDAQIVVLQVELDRTLALANVRLAEAGLARAIGR